MNDKIINLLIDILIFIIGIFLLFRGFKTPGILFILIGLVFLIKSIKQN
jgi:uncharacterized membrane protein HdeD (DUF308 family)